MSRELTHIEKAMQLNEISHLLELRARTPRARWVKRFIDTVTKPIVQKHLSTAERRAKRKQERQNKKKGRK